MHGSGRLPQNMLGMDILDRRPSVPVLPAVDDVIRDLRRQTVSFLRLRPSSNLRNVSPRPQRRLESHGASRQLASVMSWRCFPATRRHLQRPQPIRIRVLHVERRVVEEYLARKSNIGLAEQGILAMVVRILF
jgi:hypothetical protein